jgi:hypothetical protein
MSDDLMMDVAAQQAPENCAVNLPPYGSMLGAGLGVGYSNDPAEKLRYHAQQCLMVLREAHRIRQNPEMMGAIRDLIRHERDELAVILDEGR